MVSDDWFVGDAASSEIVLAEADIIRELKMCRRTVQKHRFSVPAGIENASAVMRDPRQVAACFPSVDVKYCDDRIVTGIVKVHFGRHALTYRGAVIIWNRYPGEPKLVALVMARCCPDDSMVCLMVTATLTRVSNFKTNVDLVAHINTTGLPNLFGSNVLEGAGSAAIKQFSGSLITTLRSSHSAPVEETGNIPRQDKIDNIFNFTTTMARIEADKTLSADSEAMAVLRQLQVALSKLGSEGELSEYVENELFALTSVSLDAIQHLSGEFGSALESLTRRYEPPVTMRERILHWWDTWFRLWLGR